MEDLKATTDTILNRVVTSNPRVPGVVAMVTDRQRNIYEGAAGKRRLDRDADMTTETVFAIFSTTKAITGTAALPLRRGRRARPSTRRRKTTRPTSASFR